MLCCSALPKGNHSHWHLYSSALALAKPGHVKYSCSHSDGSRHVSFLCDQATTNHRRILYFPKLSTCLCSFVGVLVVTGSQTVPVITFLKFFSKNKQKLSLFRYVFYIWKPITVLKTDSNYSDDIFFFVKYVDLGTIRKVWNYLTLFSIFVLSYRNLAVCLNWMTEVCALCAYVLVCVSMRMTDWHEVLYCQWNCPSVTGQERQRPKITACNFTKDCNWTVDTLLLYSGLIWCISSFLLYRTTDPFKRTFANIFSPNILCMQYSNTINETLSEQHWFNLRTMVSVCFYQLLTLLRFVFFVFFSAKTEETRTDD